MRTGSEHAQPQRMRRNTRLPRHLAVLGGRHAKCALVNALFVEPVQTLPPLHVSKPKRHAQVTRQHDCKSRTSNRRDEMTSACAHAHSLTQTAQPRRSPGIEWHNQICLVRAGPRAPTPFLPPPLHTRAPYLKEALLPLLPAKRRYLMHKCFNPRGSGA